MNIVFPPKEIIEKFKATHGAMSVAEGIALYNVALQAPEGTWVELGSHKGKSSTMIAAAMTGAVRLSLVEPEFSNIDWATEVADTLTPLDKKKSIEFWANYSTGILPQFYSIHFLFVDSGDHGEEIVQSEKPLYEDKIVIGGIIAFHDYGSQFTAVERCYDQLVASGKYEPIQINWQEIFDFVAENGGEEGNKSWHLYPELPHPPNFIGALRRI